LSARAISAVAVPAHTPASWGCNPPKPSTSPPRFIHEGSRRAPRHSAQGRSPPGIRWKGLGGGNPPSKGLGLCSGGPHTRFGEFGERSFRILSSGASYGSRAARSWACAAQLSTGPAGLKKNGCAARRGTSFEAGPPSDDRFCQKSFYFAPRPLLDGIRLTLQAAPKVGPGCQF
jgi:hypothetical protein